MHVRLVLSANGVKLFVREDGVWEELNESLFHITARDSNAIINSIWETDKRVVTRSIGLSLVNTKRLHVAFMRQHKGKRIHPSDPDVVTVSVAYGILERAREAK
jgi:hypothetical protein